MGYQLFLQQVVEYLRQERDLINEELRLQALMSREEKINAEILLPVIAEKQQNHLISFLIGNNTTKLRPGDSVLVSQQGEKGNKATVVDCSLTTITLETSISITPGESYDIESKGIQLLDAIIELLEGLCPGDIGIGFLQLLSQELPLVKTGMGAIQPDFITEQFIAGFNEKQKEAVLQCINRPSIKCIQGPPGTGKTKVLAAIAQNFALKGKDVLILANTHQAVNNALNGVSHDTIKVFKIGELLKNEGLNPSVTSCKSMKVYHTFRKNNPRRKNAAANVVGMTLWSAIYNLGLKNSELKPSIILVDEASQIPMAYATALGTFGSGSVIFIGDDKQMPPIFKQQLTTHLFSKSIFSYLCDNFKDIKVGLNVTYRMNDEITKIVSQHFYEPFGEMLTASDYSKDRSLTLPVQSKDVRLNDILSNPISFHELNVSTQNIWEDYNDEEAVFATNLVFEAIKNGLCSNDVAVITPFRKQVINIRSRIADLFEKEGWHEAYPLVDTVERLQGQDVEMIIVSLCSTDDNYIKEHYSFINDKNRLNVMISRAKTKVVMLKNC